MSARAALAPPSSPRAEGRIVGLDLARGLAVLGMFAAHLGDMGFGWRDTDGEGWPWLFVADGRSSAIFALLLGVTISIMTAGHSLAHNWARLGVRAAALLGLGYVCANLVDSIVPILGTLGLFVLICMGLLRWPSWALLAFAWIAATAGPFLWQAAIGAVSQQGILEQPLVGLAWWPYYTGIIWIAYPVAGMVVGRMDLSAAGTRARLMAVGGALAVAGYAVAPLLGGTSPLPGSPTGEVWWLSAAPHSSPAFMGYTPAEVIGNIGFGLLVLGLCLGARGWLARLAAPVAAVGSMALTAYVGQVVAIRLIGGQVTHQPSNVSLAAFWAVTILVCWAWRRWAVPPFRGQGPLEWAITRVSKSAAKAVTADRR